MLQLTPQSRILLALAPVDFRNGIDGLAAVCRRHFARNPLDGAIYVFRNRAGTTLKLLCYDGQGFWLCTKRWSRGRLQWWPRADGAAVSRAAFTGSTAPRRTELTSTLTSSHPWRTRRRAS